MKKRIGMRVKEKRLQMETTQEELAEKVGYTSKSMIAHVEAGRMLPPVDKLARMADALHCSVSYLIGESEECQEFEDRWIPVRERMPEDSAEVLVTTENTLLQSDYVAIATWTAEQGWIGMNGMMKVKAWRPLPAPYKK